MSNSIETIVRLTIIRPNGDTEIKDLAGYLGFNDALFSRMRDATSKAGKGEIKSYKIINSVVDVPDDKSETLDSEYCDGCDKIKKAMSY